MFQCYPSDAQHELWPTIIYKLKIVYGYVCQPSVLFIV
uniref:Uncharacterized protein n=1 Tax=Rhizophora mucronata TaxID=61149 RepID=A0A2P2N3A7_RHIMU